jgi:hypothetical protein
MGDLLPTPQGKDLANICAEHTRRIQDLCITFWHGDINMWLYRKQSRELTQQFVNELHALISQGPATSNAPSPANDPDPANQQNIATP